MAVVIGGCALAWCGGPARRTALADAAVATEVARLMQTAGLAEVAEPTETTNAGEAACVASPVDKLSWRTPPLSELPTPVIRGARRIGLLGLRGYLALAVTTVIVKIVETALGH